MRNIHHPCSAVKISNTLESLEDENEKKINLSKITKFLTILFILLIIFTIIYFTCFGCLLVLNDSTIWAPHTVTLSSEGPANEKYPDSMGEYQLQLKEDNMRTEIYYQHADRKDRFLMYHNQGNMEC